MTIVECLMTAVLFVVPPPEKATYDNPSLDGICHGIKGHSRAAIYVNEAHQLIIEYAFTRYEIPLPVSEGEFAIRYVLGSSSAKVRRMNVKLDESRIANQLVDEQWATVVVRYGPKETT